MCRIGSTQKWHKYGTCILLVVELLEYLNVISAATADFWQARLTPPFSVLQNLGGVLAVTKKNIAGPFNGSYTLYLN